MKSLIALLMLFSQSALAQETSLTEKITSYLPNSVSFDLAMNSTTVFLLDRESIKSPNASASNSDGVGQFANAISLAIAPPRNQAKGFGFKTGPEVTFAFNNLHFSSDAALLDSTDFQILRTSLGISSELNYKTDWGTPFVSGGVGMAYSWISWSSPASGGSIAAVNKNIILTLGYYTYLTESAIVKVFARMITEDENVWNKALDASQGFDVPVTSVSNHIVGASFVYAFQ
ncbi:hypothetical protein [Bdellovibrio sp. GT3]|uniref:hypothetical protein n=1 Tax=Bdellovibrio sp. GT3 TaxID=3136282 RepID=UPI0030F20928